MQQKFDNERLIRFDCRPEQRANTASKRCRPIPRRPVLS